MQKSCIFDGATTRPDSASIPIPLLRELRVRIDVRRRCASSQAKYSRMVDVLRLDNQPQSLS